MQSLGKLRKKSKKYIIFIVIVCIIIVFLLSYYVIHGFSLNDGIFNTHDDCRIVLTQPSEGAIFYSYDTIEITGSMWGGVPKKVLTWDDRYNVPISCTISASNFGTSVIANDISEGDHNICVQGQTTDGRWTDVECVTIQRRGKVYEQTGQIQPRTWVERFFPEPIATVFRPIEEALSAVVVYVTGGTSDDDLNGDNIPDEAQQSPVSPRYNPMNIPMSIIIIFGLITLLIIVVVIHVVKPYLKHRQSREREIRRSPEQRRWSLSMQKKKEQKLTGQLAAEKQRSVKFKKELEEERKKHQVSKSHRPVNIFFTKNKQKKEDF